MAIPPERVEEVARYFLDNPILRINNVPSGGANVPSVHVGDIMAMDRRTLNNRHVATVAECRGLFYWRLRKSHCWMDRNSTNVMFTREGGLSLNGGQTGLHHALNANQHALFASAVGSPFVVPTALERRDISLSLFIPFSVQSDLVIANDVEVTPADPVTGTPAIYTPKLNWHLCRKRFAGIIGLPEQWKAVYSNASVTIYESGKFLITGKLTLQQATTLAHMAIDTVRPCLGDINYVKLRECIAMQKTALLFGVGEDGVVDPTPRMFGPDRVALASLNPELPENFMPTPSARAFALATDTVHRFEPLYSDMQAYDRRAMRTRARECLEESGVPLIGTPELRTRGIGRIRGRWRVGPRAAEATTTATTKSKSTKRQQAQTQAQAQATLLRKRARGPEEELVPKQPVQMAPGLRSVGVQLAATLVDPGTGSPSEPVVPLAPIKDPLLNTLCHGDVLF